MKTALFSFHKFEESYFEKSKLDKDKFHLYRLSLSLETVQLSAGFEAVSLFVNDDASAPVLEILHDNGVQFIALRSAGHNNVDMVKAKELGMRVASSGSQQGVEIPCE